MGCGDPAPGDAPLPAEPGTNESAPLNLAAQGERGAGGDTAAVEESTIGRAARSVGDAGLRAARDINRPVKSAEPARPSETLSIAGTGGTWNALLTPRELVFWTPERRGWYAAPYSGNVTSGSYELKLPESRSSLRIMPGACRDPQLSQTHPHGAAFAHGGNALTGCAAAMIPPSGLRNTVWRVLSVGEETPPPGAHPITTLSFDSKGLVGGTAGCRAAHLPLKLDGDRFARTADTSPADPAPDGKANAAETAPDIGLTRGDCQDGPATAFGKTALGAMSGARGWTVEGGLLRVDLGDERELVASPITQRQTSSDKRP